MEEKRRRLQAAEVVAKTRRTELAQMMTDVRVEAGLTQGELASLMQTKHTAIVRLENARSIPTLNTLLKMAEVLGKRLEVRFV